MLCHKLCKNGWTRVGPKKEPCVRWGAPGKYDWTIHVQAAPMKRYVRLLWPVVSYCLSHLSSHWLLPPQWPPNGHFPANIVSPVPAFFLCLFQKRIFAGKQDGCSLARCSSSPRQQCQNTEGNRVVIKLSSFPDDALPEFKVKVNV